MKTNKLTPVHLRLIGFVCIAVLVFAGFTQAVARTSMSRLQRDPLNLQIPPMQQLRSTSCGEAVIAMTYNYAFPDSPITEQEVIDYAAANGYFTEDLSPFTSPANMIKIAKYYTDDISTGRVTTSSQGLSLLNRKLRRGEPVIIDVLSNFQDPESEAHFIVVTGLSVDPERDNAVVVHYNDPLTGTQETGDWAGNTGVWNAWNTNRDPGGQGWWLVISPP